MRSVGVGDEGRPRKPAGRRSRPVSGSAVTLVEVARLAGVSTATVSNAVNGRPGMSEETRDKVLAAVAGLNYQVNPTARNLRAGRSDSVVFLAPRLDTSYFGQLASRLSDGLEATGRHLVVQRTSVAQFDDMSADAFARLRLHDAVITPVLDADPQDLERLDLSTPVVLIGEKIGSRRLDQVCMANVEGARLATTHLLERGARRIAVLGGSPDGDREDEGGRDVREKRTAGWREAHRDHGLVPDPDLIMTVDDFTAKEGRRAVHGTVGAGRSFDGIFVVADELAVGALRALHEIGMAVPRDVQVVGFDDLDDATFTVPSLTTVDPGRREIADAVLALLLLRIEERGRGVPAGRRRPPEFVVPGVRMVHRETTRA